MGTKKAAAKKPAPKRSPTWAVRELRAVQELYDHARCTPELRDKMQDEIWKELERGR
jgi:hypothetical protein